MAKVQSIRKDKIEEALQLLDEAAEETKNDIAEMVRDRYHNLEKSFSELEPAIRSSLNDAKKRTTEAVERGTKAVDESVHNNPWPFIGGTALAGLALGFFLGNSRK